MSKIEENDWALLGDGTRVHISEVSQSGRGTGYYCPGENCRKPLQAILKKNRDHRNYFRHDPYFLDHEEKCEFSNESFRHKLAKEILWQLKQIKLPQVKKYPPDDEEGQPMLLQDFKVLRAKRAELEMTFYLDDQGELKWTKQIYPSGAQMIIRPDVVFFDEKGKPSLFIEMVATNDIDFDKSAKLRRIGVDTVRVKVPRHSETEIKKAFFITEYTFWEFNKLESETEYNPYLPSRNRSGISETDFFQRGLFRESTACRKARIRYLIRTISQYLESEQYSRIISEIGEGLVSREREQKAIRNELRETRRRVMEGVESRFGSEKEEFQRKTSGLEQRYKSKRAELIERSNQISRATADLAREISNAGKDIDQLGGEYKNEEELRVIYSAEKRKIDERRGELQRLIKGEKELLNELRSSEDRIEEEVAREEKRALEELGKNIEREQQTRDRITEEKERITGEILSVEKGDNKLKQEYFDRAISLIQGRITDEHTPLPKSYLQLLEARRLINDITNKQWTLDRTKAATQCFDSKAYKSWGRF